MNKEIIEKSELKVLVIEDSMRDLELIREQLTSVGYNLDLTHVQNEAELTRALIESRFDVILSDFKLPGFDAFDTLEISKKRCPEVPYICFSGSIGEELAIELLKKGADDYVLKDRPERLPFAIKKALAEAQEKQSRLEAEEKLKLLKRAVEASPISVFITDADGNISYINPYSTELTGYSYEEVLGKNPRFLNSGNQPEKFYKDLWNTILSGKDWTGEFINKKKNGELFWENAVISPILNNKGVVANFVAIKNDITERKKILQELIAAKERAEESDRLKSAFLANMSHEIRTPMNGIIGFAELLKEPGLTGEAQQEYISIIEQSGARMLNIINQIVDISKIEVGLMKLEMKESNINEQIEYIYNFFKPEAETRGIKLSFKNPLPAKEAIINSDREKLFAILTNLVKNAIKYTKEGVIEFGYNLKRNSEAIELEFYIKDTGIGIPIDRQSAIFKRFIQADIEDRMAYQGAGLGLAITKAYVEMLGGRIWVESEVGIGSTFFFTMPYNTEPAIETIYHQHTPSLKNEAFRKLKILIAEDDEVSEMLIYNYIKMFGNEILNARTGTEAIEICRANPDIDLIMMDIRMPEIGGHEATMQIRQFNKDVIIIAQTAYGLIGDKDKAINAGCNDYIAKPIVKTKLHEMIQKYFGKN